ncbi:MATE family efflux transporter [Geomonas sp. Red32]|uniref:MATE family efflux transporter n=1 Tax=Geomonas sp. Red32 TaxID=2912856 RepID=UPI00202D0CDC|nr:MATE family efflux transporter [Geomonas sp. Red32]MCM0080636.1 MATE family efflux transporter [Geomonas sp. Red32]
MHGPGYDLLNQPIPLLIRKLAVPTSIGYLFNTMFNVVDTFYGGKVSTEALAALSLSFPVFFLIIAIGAGISTAATSLIGHELGAGNREAARHMSIQTVSFGIVHGLLIGFIGWYVSPFLFAVMGARGIVLELATHYMHTIFTGSLFFILNWGLNAILSATGDTKSFRNFLVAGFFLNLILDPWLLYGGFGIEPMGLPGIGWGTIIIQALGNIYLVLRVSSAGMLSAFRWKDLLPDRHCYWELAKLGFPSSLNMMTVAIGIFIITGFIARYGAGAVAAYGIATRIEQVALLPVMGLNMATLALVAQNSGARRWERVVEVIKTALRAGITLMLAGTVTVFFGARLLMSLFTNDPNVVAIGAGFLHVEAFVLIAYVILYTSVSVLQGLKRPVFPLVIGLLRQIVLPVPVFYLLTVLLEWGIKGIWWGVLLVTWSAALASLYYMVHLASRIATTDTVPLVEKDGEGVLR